MMPAAPHGSPPSVRLSPSVGQRLFLRLRWPRRLRITREGKYFVGITFGVGVVAINTGNNLLYLLLGTLLALIVLSGILSELSLRHLSIRRRLPRRGQVGRAHVVEIEVKNQKLRIPSYAIEVEDLRHRHSADKRCFFLKISPSSVQVAAYRRNPARRGLEIHSGFRVATRFPFGFFEKSLEIYSKDELLVYPAIDRYRLPPDPKQGGLGGPVALGRGQGDEIMGIRPMRDGDDPRDIYWRRSTTADRMVVRERAKEVQRTIELFIDTLCSVDPPPFEFLEGFETRIREIASVTVAELRRGNSVVLKSSEGHRVEASPQRGPDAVLTFLALLTPTTWRGQIPVVSTSLAPSAKEPPAWATARTEGGDRP